MRAEPMVAILLAGVCACAAAGEHHGLVNNPFAAPNISTAAADEPTDAPTELQLRGVMLSPDPHASLANINGTVVAPGERVDGFRLVAVAPGEAVIARGERQFVLKMVDDETQ